MSNVNESLFFPLPVPKSKSFRIFYNIVLWSFYSFVFKFIRDVFFWGLASLKNPTRLKHVRSGRQTAKDDTIRNEDIEQQIETIFSGLPTTWAHSFEPHTWLRDNRGTLRASTKRRYLYLQKVSPEEDETDVVVGQRGGENKKPQGELLHPSQEEPHSNGMHQH